MISLDRIQQHIREVPEPLRAELLDLVEFLLSKVEGASARKENREWSALSLVAAMREMDEEGTPDYTISDLKAVCT